MAEHAGGDPPMLSATMRFPSIHAYANTPTHWPSANSVGAFAPQHPTPCSVKMQHTTYTHTCTEPTHWSPGYQARLLTINQSTAKLCHTCIGAQQPEMHSVLWHKHSARHTGAVSSGPLLPKRSDDHCQWHCTASTTQVGTKQLLACSNTTTAKGSQAPDCRAQCCHWQTRCNSCTKAVHNQYLCSCWPALA